MSDDWTCATCAEATGTRRYCAPTACYCGHAACPASASYVDLRAQTTATRASKPRKPARSKWDDREDATWIDQL